VSEGRDDNEDDEKNSNAQTNIVDINIPSTTPGIRAKNAVLHNRYQQTTGIYGLIIYL